MNGRIEHGIKIDKKINAILEDKPEYIKEWYLNLKANDCTPETCKDYIYKVIAFINFISQNVKNENVKCSDLTPSIIDSYFGKLRYKQDKDGNTIKTSDSWFLTNRCALIRFFDFLKNRDYIKENYVRKNINPIKDKDKERIKEERIPLTKEDFYKIQQVAKRKLRMFPDTVTKKMAYRNYAILNVFMNTGMRIEELREINMEDIDFENNKISIVAKGEKKREVVITGECKDSILKWRKERLHILLRLDIETDALFVSRLGNRISCDSIRLLISDTTEEAIGKKINPHMFRAGCISILYGDFEDIEFCRRFIGHSNVATTQRYIATKGNENQKGAEALAKIFG